MVKIEEVLGTEEFESYLSKYNITENEEIHNYREGLVYERVPFLEYIDKDVSEEAIDLLSKMLKYDPVERITPKDALNHAYFDPVRANYIDGLPIV